MTAMNWLAVYPEIFLLVMTCVVALADLFVTDPKRTPTHVLTLLTLAGVGAMHWTYIQDGETLYAMNRMVVSDPMGHLLALFAVIAIAVTLIYARPYAESREMLKGELYSLSLFSLLGISVMVSANNLLVTYIGLELMSLSLYALVALRRDHAQSTEAAMKYFVLGALASGFLLYGMSMLYGATGSLDIGTIFDVIAKGEANRQVLTFGLVFIVSGLAFKLGAVPFHMWVPDVYQGAPTAATLLIAGAPKIASFGMAMRLLVDGMMGLAADWQQMLGVLAVCSLLIGNLAAIAQTNLKRMLAYSTIAQMGFLLLGMIAGVVNGNTLSAANAYSSSLFYILTYVVTTLGTFGLIMLLARQGFEAEDIADLAGLHKRSPVLAAVMAIFLFSLAGVPPMVGFHAKLAVLQALISTNDPVLIQLAIFGVVMSLIGAFYYIRVVKVMYFDEPKDSSTIVIAGGPRTVLSLNGAAVLLLGIIPGGLMTLCSQAIVKSLAG
ncbi:NADH dehydrogenase subunit N [Sphaerotilus natans subsp. natans DSM 6575]|uniref:NADH-quinone oxidoreductase subunit N n=1 Tax=Sphaerotilus natans subsp. natans DSM 6575 TaxID=1286631 RepID=A0A059KJZ4_9BURK|nr:NADH-quinone oxidoreductase subunit NuoN [Sphaerotilus natans]KDB51781.1 NADH dehydrogenase subunit N [Sphaerotilus natans subsp. natans DSM 6575]SIQ48552.1 NADH dehydrogenase subunit N [Sphaerotilus natans]